MTPPPRTWLQRLAVEIAQATGKPVLENNLYEEFKAFRQGCKDHLLQQSYPLDLHHIRRSHRPQARTLDIILSFMNEVYGGLRVPLVAELADALEEETRRLKRGGELEKVLAKERRRRSGGGKRKGDAYWDVNQRRVAGKYCGIYALLRVSSGNHLLAEPFALAAIGRDDPTTISAFWLGADGLRVGDLMVNTYRFAGSTLCKSSDRVIEPITMSLLRAPHLRRKGNSRLLVLGGLAVGLKDQDEEALFHCRLALIKLDMRGPANYEQFREAAASQAVHDALKRLVHQPPVTEQLRPRFLLDTSRTIRALDAANVLGDIGDGFAEVRTSISA